MTKKEAAEFLNVSTRLVERYASEGRLGVITYVRGKTGKQAEYDNAAVEALKVELETPDTSLIAPTTRNDARLFAKQLIEAINQPRQGTNASVRTSEKLLLTISECRLLTGLSEATLRDAVKAETLKAQTLGRGLKVKRSDLDQFISDL